ncbi:glycosyltransferase [Rubidibacter lacunae KORDI 51-2]|uniref:Glycosyltransferase n=1 Tax=Rubidibacter lacunae KORDI 51-2 TaxID=582515 RepID=U5DE26_9CHRO|nr:exopolysaccharide biosynthesis GT4 family glycosyltransferase EpsE [Rubidibacter lacunae]ERN42758.1 glycosyltransferase [Rubidibacter lacunae KORDI 51-2]
MKIGYLIPEFPGQTHIFYWRERQALEQLGIAVDLVSTRQPKKGIMSHTWTEEACQQTTYLFPIAVRFWGIVSELLRSGLTGWWRVFRAVATADDVKGAAKLRMLALTVIGAELVSIARDRGWQHVHVHSCADAANVAFFASLLSSLTYSLTLHGPLTDYGSNQAQKWQNAAFGVTITTKLAREVKERLVGHLPPQLEVAPMGVNVERFTRRDPYIPWQRNGNVRLFSCGRLNPCKGHAETLEAIVILRQQGFPIELDIAGEDEQGGGGYHRYLDTLISERQLTGSVRLLGAVSEETVKCYLENAHLFVLASWHEPLGVAIMESMAMSVPTVSTAAGGVAELIDHESDGLLVPPRSPERLADAIARCLQSPELALHLSQRSRDKIASKFHHFRSATQLANCLQTVLNGSK